MSSKRSLPLRDKGQSFFEVIIALALISIVLITIVALASTSIRASVFSRNQTTAQRYTQQASEWLRAEKDADWTGFKVHANTPSWCLDSLYWLKSGDCSEFDLISGTIFIRSVTFTVNPDTSINTDLRTQWTDAQGTHTAATTIIFANWGTYVVPPTLAPGSTPTPTPIPAAIAWWKFDDNTGPNVADSIGSMTGAWNGTFGSQWIAGKYNSAGNFNGTDNFVTFNNPSTSNALKRSLPMSVTAWIYLNDTASTHVIFQNDTFNGVYEGIRLAINSGGSVSLDFGDGGGKGSGNRRTKTGSTLLNSNQWYHITGVYVASNNMTIYINGANDGGTYSGTGGTLDYSNIASHIGDNVGSQYFNGIIDDVKFYGYALTSAQALYAFQNP